MIDTHIKIDGRYQPAVLTLATPTDHVLLDNWIEEYQENVDRDTIDILEYVEDALTKQEKYEVRGRCPADWGGFVQRANRSPSESEEEVAGLFVLKCAALDEEIVGFTFLRRNWDRSLVMDYLARCPEGNPRLRQVKGIGFGLMLAACKLAETIQAPHFWWETTPLSFEFYGKLLKKTEDGSYIVEPASLMAIPQAVYLRLITYLQNPPN